MVMGVKELKVMVEELGLPFSYDHFAQGESPAPPYVCFMLSEAEPFAADGVVYVEIASVRIELYTETKDPEVEALVDALLTGREFCFVKGESWVSAEGLYQVVYSFQVCLARDA